MTVWRSEAWDLAPLADAVGPFPLRPFLQAVHDEVDLYSVNGGALAVVEHGGVITMAGEPDLTDYHSPLGEDVTAVIASLVDHAGGQAEFDFDSLPEEAAGVLVPAFEAAGLAVECSQHAVTAILHLPETFDDYLMGIGKKQRHEVRRKRRRYEELVGPVLHETHRGVDWAFDEFVRLHRLSAGAKGEFMTPEHEAMFGRLAHTPGWRMDMLRIPGTDKAAACLFSYSDDDGIFLYNSAYDPDLAHASPGVAIIGTMIETAIAESLPRFDFLKGDEEYKFRLGATARPLYRVRATQ